MPVTRSASSSGGSGMRTWRGSRPGAANAGPNTSEIRPEARTSSCARSNFGPGSARDEGRGSGAAIGRAVSSEPARSPARRRRGDERGQRAVAGCGGRARRRPAQHGAVARRASPPSSAAARGSAGGRPPSAAGSPGAPPRAAGGSGPSPPSAPTRARARRRPSCGRLVRSARSTVPRGPGSTTRLDGAGGRRTAARIGRQHRVEPRRGAP